jgi:putative Holliday junction resolvase
MERIGQSRLRGTVLALDLGDKWVGAAVSDSLQITINRLSRIRRSNWKQLLLDVTALIHRFDAQTLVIGLPLRLDGTTGDAAEKIAKIAVNFSRSLEIPVYLQDERLTSVEARASLLSDGHQPEEIATLIDSEAAGLILRDFLNTRRPTRPATPGKAANEEKC